jgi:hypothetical protein
MIESVKIIRNRIGGFDVRKTDGLRFVWFGQKGLFWTFFQDRDEAASFETVARAQETIEDWFDPGALAKMSAGQLNEFALRYRFEKDRLNRELVEVGFPPLELKTLTNRELENLLILRRDSKAKEQALLT